MSAKLAEISERRLERYKRRASMRDVHKKKHDFNDTYRRLEEARKVGHYSNRAVFEVVGRGSVEALLLRKGVLKWITASGHGP